MSFFTRSDCPPFTSSDNQKSSRNLLGLQQPMRWLFSALLLFFAMAGSQSYAVVKTISGTGTLGWGTGTNWSPVNVPVAGDDIVLTATGGDLVITGGGALAYASLTINADGSPRNITLNTAAATTFGTITINGNATLIIASNDLESVGLISGAGNLNTAGLGLAVSGDVNLTGTMAAAGGTLLFKGGVPQSLTHGGGNPNFANITINASTTVTVNSNLAQNGSITNNSASDFTCAGSSTFTCFAGTGSWTSPGGGNFVFNNLTFNITGGATTRTIDVNVTVNGNFAKTGGNTYNIVFAKNAARIFRVLGNFSMAGGTNFGGAAHTTAGDMYHRLIIEGNTVDFPGGTVAAPVVGTGAGAGFFHGFDIEIVANAAKTVTGVNTVSLACRDFKISGNSAISWGALAAVTIKRDFVNTTNAGNTFTCAQGTGGGAGGNRFIFDGGTGSGSPQRIGIAGGSPIIFPNLLINGNNTYVQAFQDFSLVGNGSGGGVDNATGTPSRTFIVANNGFATPPVFKLGANRLTFNSAFAGYQQTMILITNTSWETTVGEVVEFANTGISAQINLNSTTQTIQTLIINGAGTSFTSPGTINIANRLRLQTGNFDLGNNAARIVNMGNGSILQRTAGAFTNVATGSFVCNTGTYSLVYDGSGAVSQGVEWINLNNKVQNVTVGSESTTPTATALTVATVGSRQINGNFTINSTATPCFTMTATTMPLVTGGTFFRNALGTLNATYPFNIASVTSFNLSYGGNFVGNMTTNNELSALIASNKIGNVTIAATGSNTITLNNSCTPTGDLTITSGTLVLGANTIDRAAAGGTLSIAAGAGLRIGGTNTFPANYSTNTLNLTSTVEYNGTGAQTIGNQNYGNLIVSQARGGATITLPAGTIDVAGTFTASLSGYVASNTGNTFNYSGASGQTIASFLYNNLSSANNNRVLQSTGTIGIAGTYTPGTGTYTVTGSTVNFNGTGAQTISAKNYNNLTISGNKGGGNVTLANSGNILVAGTLSFTATSVTYVNTGSTVVFNGTSQSIPQVPGVGYNNLTIQQASGNATLLTGTTVDGTLDLAGGKLILNGNDLTIGASGSTTGTFSGTRMIDRASGGNLIKSFNAPSSVTFVFPLGTGSVYSPFTLSGFTATGTGSVTVDVTAAPSGNVADPLVALGRHWNVTVSGLTVTAADAEFVYGNADVNGTEASYIPNKYSGTWTNPAGSVNAATNTISAPGIGSALAGEWTAGEPTAFATVTIFYSLGGDWNTPASWSEVSFGGAPSSNVPSATDQVRIGDGQTITVGAYVITVSATQVQTTGILQFNGVPNASNDLGTVTGDGQIRFINNTGSTPNFPAGNFSNFVSAAGGTVEYGGTGGYTLPTQATYNGFTLSGTGTKTLGTSLTINGNVSITGTLNVTGTHTVAGDMSVAGTWNQTTGSLTFNRSGVQALSGAGTINFVNLSTGTGSVFSNTASFSISGNLAVGNTVSAIPFTTTAGTVTFNGTGAQTISYSGASGAFSLFNVTLGASTEVTCTANGFRINGNIVNNSTGAGAPAFYATTQPVTINGSAPQTLTGTGTRAVRFLRLTIGSLATFAPAADFTVDERITNSSTASDAIAATGGTAFLSGDFFGTGTGTLTFNNIQLEGRLTGTTSLSLLGDLVNNTAGTAGNSLTLSSPSVLSFTGSSAQSISGSGTGSLVFHGLTFSTGSRVNTGLSFTVRGGITNNSNGISGITFNQTAGTLTVNNGTQAVSGAGTGSFIINELNIATATRLNLTAGIQLNADLVNNSNGVSGISFNMTSGTLTLGGGTVQTISGTGTGSISIGGLTIAAGTTLNNDKNINIGGDITSNSNAASALNCTAGTVTFNGSTTQTITGTGTGTIQFASFTIAPGARLNVNRDILVSENIINSSNGILGIALDATGFTTTFNNGSVAQTISGGGTGTRQFGSIVIAANSRVNPSIAISYAGNFTNNSNGLSGISYGQTSGGVTFNGGIIQSIGGSGTGAINMQAFNVAAGTRVNCTTDLNFGGNNTLNFDGAGLGVPAMVFNQTSGTTTLAMGGAGQGLSGTATTGGIRFFNLTFADGSGGNYQINRGFDVTNTFTFNRTNSYGLTFNRTNGAQTFNFNNVVINANNVTNTINMQAPSGADVAHTMNIAGDIDIQGNNASPFSWNTVATSGGFYNQMRINLTGTAKTISGAGAPTFLLNWSHVTVSGTYTNTFTGAGFTIGSDAAAPSNFTNGGTGSFTMGANTSLTMRIASSEFDFTGGAFTATGTGVTVTYAKGTAGARTVPGGTFNNLTFAFAGGTPAIPFLLGGNTTVNGNMNMSTSGNIDLGAFDLTLSGSLLGTPFSSTKMLVTSGAGSLVRIASAASDFELANFEYPLGTGIFYTPMVLNSLNATVLPNSTLTIRAVPAKEPNVTAVPNVLSKYWQVATTGITLSDANVTFQYNNAERGIPNTNYIPVIRNVANTQWIFPIGSTAPGVNPMGATATTELDGNWTAGQLTAFSLNFYSIANGDWDDNTTWSIDDVLQHTGAAAPLGVSPTFNDAVFVGGGYNVTVSANTRETKGLSIASGSQLTLGTTTGHNFTSIVGTGTLALSSATLPTATITSFVSGSGGTIEYQGGAYTLPAQATYNNLTISGAGVKTSGANMVLNGSLTVATGGTFDLSPSNHTVTLARDFTNNGTYTSGTGQLTMTGAARTISGTSATTIQDLRVNGTYTSSLSNFDVPTSLSGTGTLTLSAGNNMTVSGTSTLTNLNASASGSTVNFNQASDGQSINRGSYFNLTYSNFNKVLPNTIIPIGGVYTPGTGTHTVTGNTIDFVGAAGQVISATQYNNITNSNDQDRVLANSGTIQIAGNFSLGSGAYTTTGSTVDYNGAAAQTITDLSYNNLSATGSGNKTWDLPADRTLTGNLSIGGTSIFRLNNAFVLNTTSSASAVAMSGGQLQLLAGAGLVCNGTFTNTGGNFATGALNISFPLATSAYIHARDGGVIPVATFGPSSLCRITGVTSTPPTNNFNNSFGNFEVDAPLAAVSFGFSNGAKSFANVNIINTGTGNFYFQTSGAGSGTVSGNFTVGAAGRISGYNFGLAVTAASTFNVDGNIVNNGVIELGNNDVAGGSGTFNLRALGNISNSGTIQSSNFSPSNSRIAFDGTISRVFNQSGTMSGGVLEVNKTGGAQVTLASSTSVSGLAMTEGVLLVTGNQTLTYTGTVSPTRVAGHVALNETGTNLYVWNMPPATTGSFFFPVGIVSGPVTGYRPLTLANLTTPAGSPSVQLQFRLNPGTPTNSTSVANTAVSTRYYLDITTAGGSFSTATVTMEALVPTDFFVPPTDPNDLDIFRARFVAPLNPWDFVGSLPFPGVNGANNTITQPNVQIANGLNRFILGVSNVLDLGTPRNFTWTGLVSTDWNLPANWNPSQVPNFGNQRVLIPNTLRKPVYNGPALTLRGISLASGSSATINANFTIDSLLSVSGTLNVNGAFTVNGDGFGSGSMAFAGTGGVSNFGDWNVNNISTSGLVVSSSTQVIRTSGSLTLGANAKLNLSGASFVIRSTATINGRISTIPATATLSGATNVTWQRYVAPTLIGWYFLGTPIQGQTLTNWGENFQIRAPLALPNVINSTFDRTNIFTFDGEANPANGTFANELNGWRIPTVGTVPVGRGFRVFLQAPFLSGTSKTYDNTGTVTQGDFDFNPTFVAAGFGGGGWNLVANPYPSTIDWDLPTGPTSWTKTSMLNSIYVWNTAFNQYASYIGGVGVNGGSRYIASGQAFFVRASGGSPSLVAREGVKTTINGTFLRTASIPNLLFAKILNQEGSSDQTAVVFRPEATDDFDPQWDAYKLRGNGMHLSSMIGGREYSINSLAQSSMRSITLPLNIGAQPNGVTRLEFNGIESFDAGTQVILKDNYINQLVELTPDFVYSFAVSNDVNSQGPNRFELIFYNSVVTDLGQLLSSNYDVKLYPNPTEKGRDATLLLRSKEAEKYFIQVVDLSGKEVYASEGTTSGLQSIKLPADVRSGVYLVKVNASSFNRTLKWVVD